jgi:hypothetical protein
MLEVKLPKEIDKSPAAMELVHSAFWQSDESLTLLDRYWKGKFIPYFSLELVSLGGDVHFFIRTPIKYKNVAEARIYAQYPNVEIYEVPDYTEFTSFDPSKIKIWASEYEFRKPDPYPIKTYVDFGLDKDPKEEYKIDPLATFIEFLGSVKPGDQVWHQVIVRKHETKRGRHSLFKKTDWKEDAKKLVAKLKKEWVPPELDFSEMRLTEGQKNTLKAIERSIAKQAYEVGIRSLYIAPIEQYDSSNISGLLGSFLQINWEDLNSFKPKMIGYKYPWQDYKDIRLNRRRKEMFDAYRARGYFYEPFKKKFYILNTEELATIYHFPGGVAQTPTFGRISSRKAEPPSNLPVK